jgi:hypothetical protein
MTEARRLADILAADVEADRCRHISKLFVVN